MYHLFQSLRTASLYISCSGFVFFLLLFLPYRERRERSAAKIPTGGCCATQRPLSSARKEKRVQESRRRIRTRSTPHRRCLSRVNTIPLARFIFPATRGRGRGEEERRRMLKCNAESRAGRRDEKRETWPLLRAVISPPTLPPKCVVGYNSAKLMRSFC